MNESDLRLIWKHEEEIAHVHGWDFSHLRHRYESNEELLPWDYQMVVSKYMRPTDRILDIDTGGGEELLHFGHPYKLTSATEGYPPNVELCKRVLTPLGIDFREMTDFHHMPFENESMDIILNRHGVYDIDEIFRVLRPGGTFIMQQVGEENDREIVKLLIPDADTPFPGMRLDIQKPLFESKGFTILESGEAFEPIIFYDIGALVWFARIIEWEFPGFSVDSNFAALLHAQKIIEQKGRIEGRTHRFLIVARKPSSVRPF